LQPLRGATRQDPAGEAGFADGGVLRDEACCTDQGFGGDVPLLDLSVDLLDSRDIRELKDRPQNRRAEPFPTVSGCDNERDGRGAAPVPLDVEESNDLASL
jgi:hypothetical protein